MARKKMSFKTHVLAGPGEYMTLDYGNTYSNGSFHYGIDLVGDADNSKEYDVLAFADGKVIRCENNMTHINENITTKSMGNYVIIEHANGFETRYMHMRKGSVKVTVGMKVKKGQVIGRMGNTGYSSGRHLHFSISHNTSKYGGKEQYGQFYLDPKPYLEGKKSFTAEISESSSSTSNVKTRVVDVASGRLLNVRKGPGMEYPIVRQLKRGEKVTEYERKVSTWVRIGKDEWVSGNFLK